MPPAGEKTDVTPLRQVASAETATRVRFGQEAEGEVVSTNDFMTFGASAARIEFAIPAGMTQAELLLDAELDLAHGDDCVARCIISHQLNDGATVAAISTFSGLLANPAGPDIETLRAGVKEFARKLPQISQREAAPAVVDPIPPPFDSGYNNAERNDFHAFVKYIATTSFSPSISWTHRPARNSNGSGWALLTAFEYHNTVLEIVAKKYMGSGQPKDRRREPGLDRLSAGRTETFCKRIARWVRLGATNAAGG